MPWPTAVHQWQGRAGPMSIAREPDFVPWSISSIYSLLLFVLVKVRMWDPSTSFLRLPFSIHSIVSNLSSHGWILSKNGKIANPTYPRCSIHTLQRRLQITLRLGYVGIWGTAWQDISQKFDIDGSANLITRHRWSVACRLGSNMPKTFNWFNNTDLANRLRCCKCAHARACRRTTRKLVNAIGCKVSSKHHWWELRSWWNSGPNCSQIWLKCKIWKRTVEHLHGASRQHKTRWSLRHVGETHFI